MVRRNFEYGRQIKVLIAAVSSSFDIRHYFIFHIQKEALLIEVLLGLISGFLSSQGASPQVLSA
ncbi:hypothetical protein, partial [uncultured Megasphaera sp.]